MATPPHRPIDSATIENALRNPLLVGFAAAFLLVVGTLGVVWVMLGTSPEPEEPEQQNVGLGNRVFTPEDIEAQNRRLLAYQQEGITDERLAELRTERIRLLYYAHEHDISISDEEWNERVVARADQRLTFGAGWSDEEWRDVLWWQLLREKLQDASSGDRFGEAMSIRWDVYTEALTPAVVAAKMPVGRAYIENAREQLQDGEIERLYDFYRDHANPQRFNLTDGNAYQLQYNGWDPTTQEYAYFDPMTSNEAVLSAAAASFPLISSVQCTEGGCNLYHIVEGDEQLIADEEAISGIRFSPILF
ncbi:MAG: hypothetical protein WD850_00755 [Candidatus Spechtbacterales bacterium]